MKKLVSILIGIAALGFILAIISVFLKGAFLGVGAEAYSRACTNLALIAIAITLWSKNDSP